jgi:hypothetical protein
MKYTFSLLCGMFLLGQTLQAQNTPNDAPVKKKKFSYSSGVEGSIVQFAQFSGAKVGNVSNIPRYSFFFNTGTDLNYHASKNFRPFTGIHLKNIGVIQQINDSSKYKHRVYTIGVPVGIKLYSNDHKLMFKAGADAALAFNYKWKHFNNNDKLHKGNEFFSDKASMLFTSVFAGFAYKGLSFTGHYYLNDFFGAKSGVPANDVRLITLGIGLNLDDNVVKMKVKK